VRVRAHFLCLLEQIFNFYVFVIIYMHANAIQLNVIKFDLVYVLVYLICAISPCFVLRARAGVSFSEIISQSAVCNLRSPSDECVGSACKSLRKYKAKFSLPSCLICIQCPDYRMLALLRILAHRMREL